MRKIFIVGNLSTDPVQSTVNSRNVVNVNVAVNGRRREDPADFFRLAIWSQQPQDFVLKYLKKGDKVAVSGDLIIDSFTGRDGNKVTSHGIMVDTIDSCGRGAGSAGGGDAAPQAGGGAAHPDDDLPF